MQCLLICLFYFLLKWVSAYLFVGQVVSPRQCSYLFTNTVIPFCKALFLGLRSTCTLKFCAYQENCATGSTSTSSADANTNFASPCAIPAFATILKSTSVRSSSCARHSTAKPLSCRSHGGVCNFGSLDTLHIYGLLLSQDQRAAIKSVEVSHDVIDEVDKCLPFTHMGEWRD
jgi:hypothetical protein